VKRLSGSPALLLLLAGQLHAATLLSNGVPVSFSLPAAPAPKLYNGDNGFRIVVPAGQTLLTVVLTTAEADVDVDLYARRGADVAESAGQVLADRSSEGTAGAEAIVWEGSPLPADTYYIALRLFTSGRTATGTLTATYSSGAPPQPTCSGGTQLTSGVAAPFSLGAVTSPRVFNGNCSYRVTAPGGAAQLEIRLRTNNAGAVDADLYARRGQDVAVSGDSTLYDYLSDYHSGDETLVIASPPAGVYFISLALFTLATPASGTLTATVTGGGTAPNLLANGSFELPGGGQMLQLGQGSTALPGWSVSRSSVDYLAGSALACSDGNFCVDLDGGTFGAITQSFGTSVGTAYTVTFDLAGNPQGAPAVKQLRVLVGGQALDFSFDTTGRGPANMGWTSRSFAFTATGAVTALEFRSMNTSGGSWGAMIDTVRVVAGDASPGGSAGPVGWWKFDEGAGLAANDSSSNGNTGDLVGGPAWVAGRLRSALSFNGASSFVTGRSPGTAFPTGSAPRTIAAWIRMPPAAGRGNTIFFSGNLTPAQATEFYLQVLPNGRVAVGSLAAGAGLSGSRTVDNSDWHLVAGVYEGAPSHIAKIYVDGIPDTERALAPLQTGSASNWRIGQYGAGGETFNGTIDDVRLYNRALGASEIQALFAGTDSGAGSPALGVASGVEFGAVNVGRGEGRTLSLRNSGTAALTVTSLVSSNPQFTVLSPVGIFSIPAGGDQAAGLRFAPSAIGSQTATLTIASNDPIRPSATVLLTGTGQAAGPAPAITPSTTTLSFSTQPGVNPAPQSFAVRNTGQAALNFLATTNQAWLSVSPTQGSLPAGNTATLTARVNVAGLAAGNHAGEIRISEAAGVAAADPEQAAPVIITVRLAIATGGCPPGPSATPAITRGAIVNAASFANPALPNGSIARGSIFTLFGAAVGPSQLQAATRFPLSTTLGCVSVQISRGSTTVDAIPLAAISTQVNAILPSNAPLGDALLTVTWNGRASAAVPVRIVETSLGIFTATQSGMGPGIFQNFVSQSDQPLNSPRRPAARGQTVTAWGTGLGPIPSADNVAPPTGDLPAPVEIEVGGKRVTSKLYSGRGPCCAGLDQVVFQIPGDAPPGCYVPVTARAGVVTSNTVTIAIRRDGGDCSDPANPIETVSRRGGRIGKVQLLRLDGRLQLDATQGFANVNVDLGAAAFAQAPGGEFDYNPILSLPPAGSCAVFSAGGLDAAAILSGSLPALPPGSRILNAGSPITVTGPRGNQMLPRSTDLQGLYFNLIGGSTPLPGVPALPPFLDPGSFTIRGPGGPDIGSFTASVTFPEPVMWTNRGQLVNITRLQGATLTWSGGDPASQAITIIGGNLDQESGAGAAFLCSSELEPRSFTVPASVLNALPASNPQRPGQTVGFLLLGVGPSTEQTFTATGLEVGVAKYGQIFLTTAYYR